MGEAPVEDWVIVDCQIPGEYAVLAVGNRLKQGASIRTALRGPSVRVIPSAVHRVVEIRSPLDYDTAAIHGTRYRVCAVPVLGQSGLVHAVMCCLAPIGTALPERPIVGAWEWDVPARETRWSDELQSIYRIPAEERRDSYRPRFFLQRMELADALHLQGMWAAMAAGADEQLRIEVFRTRRDDGVLRQFRLSGRPVISDAGTVTHFRGITHDVTDLAPIGAQDRENSSDPEAGLMEALFGAGGRAMAILDVRLRELIRWLSDPLPGIAWPDDGRLAPPLIAEQEVELAHSQLGVIGTLPIHGKARVVLNLLSTEGTYVPVEFEAEVFARASGATDQVLAVVRHAAVT